ncbi:MAG: hypothetical protein Q8873_08870 [Bacillota bacterium]|nr:hypothetical protein [Bacillota bacterium]
MQVFDIVCQKCGSHSFKTEGKDHVCKGCGHVLTDEERDSNLKNALKVGKEIEESIEAAKKLLRERGYEVIKITECMQEAWNECCDSNGEKDCMGCSCSICIKGEA